MSVIHSMTGFARITGRVPEQGTELATWTMSIKSVNHRFLDLHLRMPGSTDALEMELRRRFKQRVLRGHLEVTLVFDRATKNNAVAYDRELVAQFVAVFRAAQQEHGLSQEPDLNTILRLPGVFGGNGNSGTSSERREDRDALNEALQASVLQNLDGLLNQLDHMRAVEGEALAAILRDVLDQLEADVKAAAELRSRVQTAYHRRLRERMQALLDSTVDEGRLLQEAALLADRSDVEEEIVRLLVHIEHFRALLSAGGGDGARNSTFCCRK